MPTNEWKSQWNSFNSLKVLKHLEYWKEIPNGKIPGPVLVSIDPMNACNMKCPHCFDEHQEITMFDFTKKKIKDVNVGDNVFGVNKDGRLVSNKVLKKYDNGPSTEMYKITFEDDEEITCSPEHRIWHSRGRWKKASEFKIGDYVEKHFRDIRPELNDIDYKQGYISGMGSGDGCFWMSKNRQSPATGRFRLAILDKEPMDYFGKCCNALDIKWHWGKHKYNGHKDYKKDTKYEIDALWITDDINAKKVKTLMDKSDGSLSFIYGWIAGFFDAEGSGKVISFAQKKSKQRKTLMNFLTKVGFSYKISGDKNIRLRMNSYDRFNFFLDFKPKIKRKMKYLFDIELKNKTLIKNIEKISGAFHKYDIETETHNYLVRGVLVHNCNAVEALHSDKMSIETIDQLIKTLTLWNTKAVCIGGGGESLLNNNTHYLINELNKNNIKIGIVTNGLLLDKYTEEAKKCEWIGISVDAATPETFAKMKGIDGSNFYKVLNNIDSLAEKNITEVGYKYLIHPNNYNEIYESAKIAKDIGCNLIHIRPGGNPWFQDIGYEFTDEMIDEALKQMERAQNLNSSNFKVYGITHKFNKTWAAAKSFKECWGAYTACFVAPNGTVGLCCDRRGDSTLSLGSIYDPSCWGSQKHIDMVKSINTQECPRCTLSHINEVFENVIIEDKMGCDFI